MSHYLLPNDINAFMYYLYKWKTILNTPHLILDAIHAKRLSHNIDNHPERRYSTPYFTAAIIELHLIYKLE